MERGNGGLFGMTHGALLRRHGGHKMTRYSNRKHIVRKGVVRSSLLALAISLSGCVTQPTGGPDKDGWLGGAAAIRESNEMNAKKMIPVAIDCKFAGITAGKVKYKVKFKYKLNKTKVRGHWQVGDSAQIAHQDVVQGKRGYRRSFTKNIYDPTSGERALCVIWQN